MSTIVTVTELRTSTIYLRADPSTKIEELVEILEGHQSERDDLSLRIRKWAIAALNLDGPMEAWEGQVALKVDELARKILVDPIQYQLYQDPVIDKEGWTWERGQYEMLRSCMPFSPLSNAPFSELENHAFASKMIAWVSPLIPEDGALVVQGEGLSLTQEQKMLALFVSVQSRQAAENRALARMFDQATERFSQLEISINERLKLEEEKSRIAASAQTAKVQRDLNVIKERHQSERSIIQDSLDIKTRVLERTEEKLEVSIAMISDQNVEIANLRQTAARLQAQVNAASSGGGGGCTIL